MLELGRRPVPAHGLRCPSGRVSSKNPSKGRDATPRPRVAGRHRVLALGFLWFVRLCRTASLGKSDSPAPRAKRRTHEAPPASESQLLVSRTTGTMAGASGRRRDFPFQRTGLWSSSRTDAAQAATNRQSASRAPGCSLSIIAFVSPARPRLSLAHRLVLAGRVVAANWVCNRPRIIEPC